MMKIRNFICFFCFISLPVILIAEESATKSTASHSTNNENQVYKSVDSDGNVSFSDAATDDAEKIKVRALPVINISPTPEIVTNTPSSKAKKSISYSQFVITSPKEDENIWNQTVITAQVKLQPGLNKNHKITIMLDGVALPGKGLSRPMENLNRGTHTLSAYIKDSKGGSVQEATPVQFHVHKTSILNQPANRP